MSEVYVMASYCDQGKITLLLALERYYRAQGKKVACLQRIKALEGQEKFADMDVEELLRNLDKLPEEIRTAVRNNGGGHYNHAMFWEFMSPDGGGNPEGELAKKIDEDLGGLDKFKEDFKKAALGQFGSGWAWLVLDNGKLKVTATPNQDNPISEGKKPLLGIDVW